MAATTLAASGLVLAGCADVEKQARASAVTKPPPGSILLAEKKRAKDSNGLGQTDRPGADVVAVDQVFASDRDFDELAQHYKSFFRRNPAPWTNDETDNATGALVFRAVGGIMPGKDTLSVSFRRRFVADDVIGEIAPAPEKTKTFIRVSFIHKR